MKRIALAVLATLAATLGLVLAGSPAQAAPGDATVSVVHGIPNTPVNVFVNGKSTLANFKPGTVAGPLSLPAATYKVDVFPAANTAGTGAPLLTLTAPLPAGANVTIVAHLDASGKPKLTPFINDISTIAAGKARLVVRHTAAAPAVDVLANGTAAFKGLTNPNEAKAELAPGTIQAAVALAGTTTPVIGPAPVTLKEGTETIVYAIGSAAQKTLALVVQEIPNLHANPAGVPSGTGGFAASHDTIPVGVWVLSTVGALLALTGGASALRSARARR